MILAACSLLFGALGLANGFVERVISLNNVEDQYYIVDLVIRSAFNMALFALALGVACQRDWARTALIRWAWTRLAYGMLYTAIVSWGAIAGWFSYGASGYFVTAVIGAFYPAASLVVMNLQAARLAFAGGNARGGRTL